MLGVRRCWDAAGSPEPNWQGRSKVSVPSPAVRRGVCALTGDVGPVVEVGAILSDLFSTWDRLPHRLRSDAGLSFAAAWAFKERVHQQLPHGLVDGSFGQLDPLSLFEALCTLPADPGAVVCVPQSRQKHVLPFCELGTVRVDDETLAWDAGDVARLHLVRDLRRLGFGEAALLEPAPRWVVMARIGVTDQAYVLDVWRDLDVWRAHPAYLDVACRATRTKKENNDG